MSRREKVELAKEQRRVVELFEISSEISAEIIGVNAETGQRLQRVLNSWKPSVPADGELQLEYERLLKVANCIGREVRSLIWVEREEEESLIKEVTEPTNADVGNLLRLNRRLRELKTRELEIHKPRLREASGRYRDAIIELESFVYAV
jgi:hypothetical protein